MHVDTDAEILRLRAVLRDLVALSAIPAVWTGREPPAVATGLADELVDLLQLDFAFVRLCDPDGAGAVEVTRGEAWTRFPEWLESHCATSPPSPRREIVPDVGDGAEPCRGIAIRIGVSGEGGVVAAASRHGEFPTATDELLLSLAANQATTAFQNARLIQERRRAEEELRHARNELEMKVVERTTELRRSEAYLAEAQRLTHTGSFAIDVATREVIHSSDEHSRLYGFDPEQGTPPLGEFLQRIHPEDRAKFAEALERGIREGTNIEVEYRVVFLQSSVSHHRAVALPVFGASGELDEFVGTIMDVTERRRAEAELARLAGEQAALRRVATVVAREGSQLEVFTAIAKEIGQLLVVEEIRMLRYEDDRSAVVVASWGRSRHVLPIGSRVGLQDESTTARVFRTGKPARIDEYARVSGPIAETARSAAIRCVVATPILVEGRLWGAMTAGTSHDEPLPPETESRLGEFTELMATAIANTESHARADRLADEQAALRRVATLVAKEASPAEVFARVAEEAANVLGIVDCALWRDEGDTTVSAVAVWGASVSGGIRPGTRLPVDGNGVIPRVLWEGRPCRTDDYSAATGSIAQRAREQGLRSAVGCPIVVRGRTWGVMAVATYDAEPFPPETDARLAQFSELVATAIANAEARAEVERLAEEQAALRRVATLVAEGASPTAVLDAVAAEVGRLLHADQMVVSRYEPGAEVTVVAQRWSTKQGVAIGARIKLEGDNVQSIVRRTGRPARLEHFERAHGPIAELARSVGVRSVVGAPIIVDGRLWGVISASWNSEESPPPDTEARMLRFAQLLDAAIANADSRDQLTASRARLVTTADEARRRVARDLHDGAQSRLIHTVIALEQARARADLTPDARSLVGAGLLHARAAIDELRELAHGIHPAILTNSGLAAAVDVLADRAPLPVTLSIPDQRYPTAVESAAYFVVAEALTNVVKHAHADHAEITATVRDNALRIDIRDNGSGGTDPNGHGLIGMADRVTALGGRLTIDNPPTGGTHLTAKLPLQTS